ncbi:type II toxin-antitoxin system RelE/ParE family toxin [Pseudomonas sp. NPDC090202]|uniref:type II toxin-antitoxin system RelE/ParE family toxin n=1 Tax=unclassified Pseudomonas TaxID=196821 RepID=UPI003805DA1E
MIFIETTLFTRHANELLDDDGLRGLQQALAQNPLAGRVIEGTGGIRKIRVASKGHGKRGGARVIYYHFTRSFQIALLMIYAKNEQVDLTHEECRALKRLIEGWGHQ